MTCSNTKDTWLASVHSPPAQLYFSQRTRTQSYLCHLIWGLALHHLYYFFPQLNLKLKSLNFVSKLTQSLKVSFFSVNIFFCRTIYDDQSSTTHVRKMFQDVVALGLLYWNKNRLFLFVLSSNNLWSQWSPEPSVIQSGFPGPQSTVRGEKSGSGPEAEHEENTPARGSLTPSLTGR